MADIDFELLSATAAQANDAVLVRRGNPIAAFLAEQINAWDPNHFKD